MVSPAKVFWPTAADPTWCSVVENTEGVAPNCSKMSSSVGEDPSVGIIQKAGQAPCTAGSWARISNTP